MPRPLPPRLTPDEHLVVTARSLARSLGARLVVTPVDPGLYRELSAFLNTQGAAALAALAALHALPTDQLHARLAQIAHADASGAHLQLVHATGDPVTPAPYGTAVPVDDWTRFDLDSSAQPADATARDEEPWPYDEAGA